MCVSIAYASLVVGVFLVTYIGVTCELDDPVDLSWNVPHTRRWRALRQVVCFSTMESGQSSMGMGS